MRSTLGVWTLTLACLVAPAAAETVRLPEKAPDGDARAAQTWARMATLKVSLEFDDMPALEAFAYLRRVSGINLVLDGHLRAEGVLDERRISLEVADVPLRSALSLVLEFTELTARWKNGVLFVTTPDRARGELLVRLYDVRDITFTLTPFAGPSMGLASGNSMDDGGLSFLGDPPEDGTPTQDDIVELIRSSLGEDFEVEGTSIAQIGGQLCIRQTPAAHAEIAKVLAQLRAAR